ncbi:MAG: glycosyltransferase family 2 protein [Planctomycetia bacterium]|nr:glycosyltransferase family 2 protein [Planctomycetia bacterium]
MSSHVEISFVVPVYNGRETIGSVVERIHDRFRTHRIEVVLVNDGSQDDSEDVCSELAGKYPDSVSLVQLARNFGEHNAVLAGLNETSGQYVAVLDDDGQNPPEEVQRLWENIRLTNKDVVYGRYTAKRHSWFRNVGSWFNDRMATLMLTKPRSIYLSSFKIMSRALVDEITKYRGPFPYIDGLIFRSTQNIGQIDVEHRPRIAGQSGYSLKKLLKLWLNMFLGFSITPLRVSLFLGLVTSVLSLLLLLIIVVERLWIDPTMPVGIPSVLVSIAFFAGVQLFVLGMVGEYVGRVFLEQNGMPQYVVRYVKKVSSVDE